jgi:sarcosine oxidase
MTDDIVIVGAGIFGLSTAYELARRGHSVLAIDRFGSGHPATSSTGASRSIRIAYDHPFYVELALEAIESWRRLEAASNRALRSPSTPKGAASRRSRWWWRPALGRGIC